MPRTLLLPGLIALLLSACAVQTPPAAVAPAPIEPPAPSLPQPEPEPVAPVETPVAPPPAPQTKPVPQGLAVVAQLVPAKIRDRQGWINDMDSAFTYLKVPATAENVCALAAVIEQESSWQSDPVVPGLDKIVWGKIEERAHRYLVPLPVVKAALLKTSPNGQSYKARIDNLRTEREMNALFEDMAREATKLGLPLNMKNPIRTGGPMQVSVEFAEAHAKVWPYPYNKADSIRHEVFTRRGGVYFGAAILLQYPAPYSQMLYRFADFNAGRYASRNAAFQQAVARLSGRKLALDGDLLSYQGSQPKGSETMSALLTIGSLGMSRDAIVRDLKLEKSAAFGQSELYRKVYAQVDRPGKPAARETLPDIRLVSPKITRKLTTAWFANRVQGRYQACMARQAKGR